MHNTTRYEPITFPLDNNRFGQLTNTVTARSSYDLTPYMTKLWEKGQEIHLLAVYIMWLHRVSGTEQITLGTLVQEKWVPVTITVQQGMSYNDLLDQVEQAWKSKTEQTDASYSFMQFPSTFRVQQEPLFHIESQLAAPLHAGIIVNETKARWNMYYDSHSFREQTIDRFMEQLERLAEQAVLYPHITFTTYPMLSRMEQQLYQSINQTVEAFPAEKTILDIFHEVVEAYGERVALQTDEATYTYNQLEAASNRVATMLLQHGVELGQYVSLFMERSIEATIALLGILKAGAAYVPLDPHHPRERNAHIITETNSHVVLSSLAYRNLVIQAIPKAQVLWIEDIELYSEKAVKPAISPLHPAYVIFTSGSTGTPKGVILHHQGVVNYGLAVRKMMNVTEEDIFTQFITFSFDASIHELFGGLLNGVTLHFLTNEERMDSIAFAKAVKRVGITCIPGIPAAFFNQLVKTLPSTEADSFAKVKSIGVGGELLTGEVVRSFQATFSRETIIYNLYGPTECTVTATYHAVTKPVSDATISIPIGKPLANYEIYLVNESYQLCPIGVPGEILISTVGISKGYLHMPEKTKEVFIPDPFSQGSGKIFYKTGDLGRILEDGNMEYLERKDFQVKIRGHRIEMGEIEERLATYPGIQNVTVIVKKDRDNQNRLIAFYTTKTQQEIDPSLLQDFISQKLPPYMVPAQFGYIPAMPITPTGKIDRKQLASIELKPVTRNQIYTAPRTEIEQEIARVWQTGLGVDRVGLSDNFFEIGGHSLKIIELLVELKPKYPMIKINDFFTHPTVQSLAYRIEELYREKQETEQASAGRIGGNDQTEEVLAEYPERLHTTKKLVRRKQRTFLITGATGYLGSHLLYELLQKTPGTIYCLVRGKDVHAAMDRLYQNYSFYFGKEQQKQLTSRVKVMIGDLQEVRLGLGKEDWYELVQNVDAIMHCGADVSHFGDAQHFYQVNVRSTETLLDLAREKQGIHFHYVSTIGIPEELSHAGKWHELRNAEQMDYSIVLENHYVNSKWESEKHVMKAFEQEGIPVTIYRAGNLSSHSLAGTFQRNMETNAMYRMCRAMFLLGIAPHADWLVDFTPIDFAGKAIATLALQEEAVGAIFHVVNPKQIPYVELLEHFQSFGYKLSLVSQQQYEQWLFDGTEKNREGMELAITQLEGDGARNSNVRFACPKTTALLQKLHISCPQPTKAYFKAMVKYAIANGYFPMPTLAEPIC
ncbi:amino acid adenylation domain-containing protein [Brevibacillus laterosporus]|uniref:non-ribosomal peptide synthetase family protein n=1 Tax=Brevibacillus laterosporus TaxID=1465 RepID=UPI00112BA4D7|nr:non-ribosomal peptide synthetase [Brevibacillus laterosporus]MED4763642.1 amino acid adenylation domain-containing protein [Brevibacillus laterosporus]TPH20824.1 amino acid adenylation domain-containing protein [Brevibacillus laterosporus]